MPASAKRDEVRRVRCASSAHHLVAVRLRARSVGDRPAAGQHGVGLDVEPRLQHERALAGPRVRQREPRRRADDVPPTSMRSRSSVRSPQCSARTRPCCGSIACSASSRSSGSSAVSITMHGVEVARRVVVDAVVRDRGRLVRPATPRRARRPGEVGERARRRRDRGLAVAEVRAEGDDRARSCATSHDRDRDIRRTAPRSALRACAP